MTPEEKIEKMEKWIDKHPILHKIITTPLILGFFTFHLTMCFLSMVFGIQYEYYHGPRLWKKK
jgi:hypothetical protein